MYVYHMCVMPMEAENNICSLGIRVTDGYKSYNMGYIMLGYQGVVILRPKGDPRYRKSACRDSLWGPWSPLEEHPVLLSTEPPSQHAKPLFSCQYRHPLSPLQFLFHDKVPSLHVERLWVSAAHTVCTTFMCITWGCKSHSACGGQRTVCLLWNKVSLF